MTYLAVLAAVVTRTDNNTSMDTPRILHGRRGPNNTTSGDPKCHTQPHGPSTNPSSRFAEWAARAEAQNQQLGVDSFPQSSHEVNASSSSNDRHDISSMLHQPCDYLLTSKAGRLEGTKSETEWRKLPKLQSFQSEKIAEMVKEDAAGDNFSERVREC